MFQFDSGFSDNGIEIEGTIEQAYNDLGSSNLKKISLLNPRTASSSSYSLAIYTNMDYKPRKDVYLNNVDKPAGTKWNTKKWSAPWNLTGTYWASNQANTIISQWIMSSAAGVKASVVFKTKTKGILIDWYETGIRYEQGSGIL